MELKLQWAKVGNFNNWLPDNWGRGKRFNKSHKLSRNSKDKCLQRVIPIFDSSQLFTWDWTQPGGKRFLSKNPFDNGQAFCRKLEKKGFLRLGNGHYSTVLAKPDSDRVIKVCHNEVGDAWIDYCLWAAKKGYAGTLAPKVYSYKKIGNFYVAIIERMSYNAYNHNKEMKYFTIPYLLNQSIDGCREAEMLLDVVLPGCKKFAQDLHDEFKNGRLDLHNENIMFRSDGSICVTDPVCHRSSLTVKRLKARDFGLAAC